MEIKKTVVIPDVDVYVEVDPEDVLDEMSLEEIQSYYKKRFKNNIFTDLTDEEIKEVLIQLITCPSPLQPSVDRVFHPRLPAWHDKPSLFLPYPAS